MVNNTCGCEHTLYFMVNKEGVGLNQLYSDMLHKIDDEVIIFMHDDIEFLKSDWGKEILRMFNENEEYGIIGVAGAKDYNENDGYWWSSKRKYGQVMHRNNGKTWLTQFSPLLEKDLEEVCVIDVLFMAVAKNRLGGDFDRNIDGFHFYDITFCLNNFLSKWCKIGVTTNIRILHNSVGNLDESWHKAKKYVLTKYYDNLPISVK